MPRQTLALLFRYAGDRPAALVAGSALSLLAVACHLAGPWALTVLVDEVITGRQPQRLGGACLLIAGLAVGAAICEGLQAIAFSTHSTHLLKTLRAQLYDAYRASPLAEVQSRERGALVALAVGDAESFVRGYRSALAEGVVSATRLAGAIVVVMVTFPPEVVAAFCLGAAVQIGFGAAQHHMQRAAVAAREAHASLISRLTEVEVTTVDILVHHAIAAERQRVTAAAERAAHAERRLTIASQTASVSTVVYAVLAGVIYYNGGQRVLEGSMSLGALVALTRYLQMVQQPAAVLMSVAIQIKTLEAAASRLRDVLKPRGAPAIVGAPALTAAAEAVCVDHVSLVRPNGTTALHDIRFTVRRGEVVAIVGSSGSGKTTLAQLIAGLQHPSSGKVRIHGSDLRTWPPELRARRISAVFQPPTLITSSMRDNITLGEPYDAHRVVEAATRAGLSEVIRRSDRGLEVLLGAAGVHLSTGEILRMALARAILKEPDILVLDEFTSALDPALQSALWEEHVALARRANITVIAITHSIHLAQTCDRILVLSGGRLAGVGTHEELQGECPEYQRQAQASSPQLQL